MKIHFLASVYVAYHHLVKVAKSPKTVGSTKGRIWCKSWVGDRNPRWFRACGEVWAECKQCDIWHTTKPPPPHHRFTPQTVNTHTHTQKHRKHTHTFENIFVVLVNTIPYLSAQFNLLQSAEQIVLTRVLLSFWIPPPGDEFGSYIAEYFVFCLGCISLLSLLYLIIK